ncbi:MAG: HAD-IA family hydrolase [Candidatus Saccharibacteria bacterium]|nr:HAD-IA family hydrolase [Candidatus Saccharibacteria bacterium]
MNNFIALGQALAKARKSSNLTQLELCSKTGIAYSTLTKIERGAIKKPNIFTVFKIAQATNLQIEDLLTNHRNLSVDTALKNIRTDDYNKVQNKRIKFIYFDVHQVLINSSTSMIASITAKLGIPLVKMEKLWLRYNEPLCRGQISIQEFNHVIDQAFQTRGTDWSKLYIETTLPNTAIQKACRWAMKEYKVGLLSNAFPGNIPLLINNNIIPKNYDVIVDSSQVGLIKPQPEIYAYAQNKASVEPEEILLVDDRSINILMAQNQGWHGYHILPQHNKHDFLESFQAFLGRTNQD